MGRGSSGIGGNGSGGAGGGASKTEQSFYDLKNASQKTVKSMLDKAPQGTVIAYSPNPDTVVVYEKHGRTISGDVWMHTVMGGNGITTEIGTNRITRDIQAMTRGGDKKGMTKEQRKRYNSKGKKLIKDYWNE